MKVCQRWGGKLTNEDLAMRLYLKYLTFLFFILAPIFTLSITAAFYVIDDQAQATNSLCSKNVFIEKFLEKSNLSSFCGRKELEN